MRKGRKQQPATRVEELREQAREVAGHSGEALKEFAETTGHAAKEFAGKAREAAKELVDAIERASKRVEPAPTKRPRRLLRVLIAAAIGAVIFGNERAREAITGAIRRARGEAPVPDVWRPEPAKTGNGEVREPVAEETGS
jgi:Sec-independent protein translocase protein TatA